jgi:hypothetical protein
MLLAHVPNHINHRYPLFWTPLFLYFFFNSSLLWDVFIINSVEQLQTLPKTLVFRNGLISISDWVFGNVWSYSTLFIMKTSTTTKALQKNLFTLLGLKITNRVATFIQAWYRQANESSNYIHVPNHINHRYPLFWTPLFLYFFFNNFKHYQKLSFLEMGLYRSRIEFLVMFEVIQHYL